MKYKCETCNYFSGESPLDIDHLYTADCRRYAPKRTHGVGTDESDRLWPLVVSDYWCGEHTNWDGHKKAK